MNHSQRNSNLELLRIIAMLFIIAHHLVTFALDGLPFVADNLNTFVLYFITMFGKMGVNLFIFISAYFMIKSKFTLRKLLILGGEVYFYSFLFLAIGILFLTPEVLSIPTVGASLLPISHDLYWFVTCYIVLMLFSPFLNKFINGISKNTFIKVIILSVLLWSVFPTILPPMTIYPAQDVFIGNNFQYSPLIWFFVLYLIGSYIRLYVNVDKLTYNKLISGFVISVIIVFIGTCIFGFLDLNSTAHLYWSLPMTNILDNTLYMSFFYENKFFALTASIFLFLIFLKRKEFSNKYINYIAGSALGVYLIHGNRIVGEFTWPPFNFSSFYHSPYLILMGIAIPIIVYMVCSGIDIIRRLTIEKLWIWIVDTKLDSILSKWINDITNYLIEKVF